MPLAIPNAFQMLTHSMCTKLYKADTIIIFLFADKENETPRDDWFLHIIPHVAKLYRKPSGPTLSAGTALRVSFSTEGTSMRTCPPVAPGFVSE